MPLAHVAIAVESAGVASPHAFPLMVMQTLLGNWTRTSAGGKNMASRLAQVAAEDELCHSFMSFNTCYKDTGLFGIYFVAENNTVQDMTWHIMDKLVALCHTVTEEEVARARQQLKACACVDGSPVPSAALVVRSLSARVAYDATS